MVELFHIDKDRASSVSHPPKALQSISDLPCRFDVICMVAVGGAAHFRYSRLRKTTRTMTGAIGRPLNGAACLWRAKGILNAASQLAYPRCRPNGFN